MDKKAILKTNGKAGGFLFEKYGKLAPRRGPGDPKMTPKSEHKMQQNKGAKKVTGGGSPYIPRAPSQRGTWGRPCRAEPGPAEPKGTSGTLHKVPGKLLGTFKPLSAAMAPTPPVAGKRHHNAHLNLLEQVVVLDTF